MATAASTATAPSRRSTSHSVAAAAKAITAWLLGKDQSPRAGQVSSVKLRGIERQGRSSRTNALRIKSTPYATATTAGAASARAIIGESERRARHHAVSISAANSTRPKADHVETVSFSSQGACCASWVMSV